MARATEYITTVDEWLDEDKLLLLECWMRDGYTYGDIANKIGVSLSTLKNWRIQYPEIEQALKNGKEITDYKVENALLKSALGYRTKESKVIMELNKRTGKMETIKKETTLKDIAPNPTSCQVWLYNRVPDKWKRNRDNIVELNEEDSNIQITISRKGNNSTSPESPQSTEQEEDESWVDEINDQVTITKKEPESGSKKPAKKVKDVNVTTNSKPEDDKDYWPDDWEE